MRLRVVLILAAIILAGSASVAAASPNTGDPAPDFTLKDVKDVKHSLSDYAGKVILLAFWDAG